jgi:hypothetical protein
MSDLELFNQMPDCQSKRWISLHFDYPHDDFCLIWPFARKGCGYVSIGGDDILVHRLMCEYRNGPAPSDEHYATHRCGRGDQGCINPNHVRWGTPSQNQIERFEQHGVKPRFRITAEQAKEVRELRGLQPARITAETYGISESNVYLIQTGRTWRASPRHRVLTADEVRLIRSTPWEAKPARQFAEEFGCSILTVQRARQGASYKWVTESADPPAEYSQAERS